jgi:hypothetical protein
MFDILFHKVPWSGDRIRLYRRTDEPMKVFVGEFYVKIKHGNVLVLDNAHIPSYIRRDLPRWSERHCCWEYWYSS